jgi:hypothetical protein
MLSEPSYAIYWHPDVVHYNMEGIIFYSTGWLKTVCVLTALFWVAWRGYKVLSKPLDELVNLLGLEVPVAPIVSLAGIKADGVLLHWKLPDQRGSVLKYLVRINGIDLGDVSPQETSITIENLQPDHHYVIRIVTLNSANFQAPSNPIRLKTLPASSEQFYNPALNKEMNDADSDEEYTPTPIIRPNKSLGDNAIPPVIAPVMAREHSNSISRVRRTEPARRNSPASQTLDQARSAQEAADSSESIKQLTEKLDALRREIDEVEKQIAEEDEEFLSAKASLSEKRDEKKQILKEKEDASRDLRKEVASLERANTVAQGKKTQQEKLLRQKEGERKKMKEDVALWRREIEYFKDMAKKFDAERVELAHASEEEIRLLREKHAAELQTNKALEEEIRQKGSQVKLLEEERKRMTEGDDSNEPLENTENFEAEDKRRWNALYSALQHHYAQVVASCAEAERAYHLASERLAHMQQRRTSQPTHLGGIASQELLPMRRNSLRMRPSSMREPITSGGPGGFVHSTAPSFHGTIQSSSPNFPNAVPYFNINNGMALAPSNNLTFSQAEFESLTGGAPMSPTAGALLPSGLLGDETDKSYTEDGEDTSPPHSTMDPSPSLHHILPGLGAPGVSDMVHSPSSPVSIHDHSPSAFASPRESAGHLSYFPATENMVDSDRRSIRSTSSSQQAAGAQTTRFGSFFNLNRQRGKTLADQGPPLGSLKPSQSQSLPRNEASGLDATGAQRRRGSHSGAAWYEAFMRSSRPALAESSDSPQHVTTRKRPFNMFGSKGDPWLTAALGIDRSSSPRPASTISTDPTALPRPSTETQTRFGWPVDNFGTRSNTLGPDWSMGGNNTSWSRVPSRRPSIQHGSTASLVHDELLMGDSPDFSTTRSPTQAPIGTRPQSSASHMSPAPPIPPTPPKQLNPAAPQFKSLFSREKKSEEEKAKRAAEKAAEKAAEREAKEAKKAEKSQEKKAKSERGDKVSRKDKDKAAVPEITTTDPWKETSSPLDPRRSRDNRSISTADESTASPRESLERSISQSESQGYLSNSKESFMQKLSRKSSSSQFLPFGKGKASIFSKKTSEVAASDTEDDPNGYSAKGGESATGSPSLGTPKDKSSALSWGSIKRIGRRGDKTPSINESITSETTGDEDDETPSVV